MVTQAFEPYNRIETEIGNQRAKFGDQGTSGMPFEARADNPIILDSARL